MRIPVADQPGPRPYPDRERLAVDGVIKAQGERLVNDIFLKKMTEEV